MQRALIAGCGYVGIPLGLRLREAGHEVWGLRRRVGQLPAEIRPIEADLTDPESLATLPAPLDVVYHMGSPPGFDETAYRSAFEHGVANLAAALQGPSRPSRLVMVSSTSVYGQTDGSWVDETSPTEPLGFAGRAVLAGECRWRSSGLQVVVVRFGGIYGPGRTRLLDRVRAGQETIGPDAVYTNRIHRDDCVGVLEHVMALADPDPVYLGVDSDPAERGEVVRWLASELEVEAPHVQRDVKGPRRGGNKRCRNDRLLASGYVFRHASFRDGYRAILRAMAAET